MISIIIPVKNNPEGLVRLFDSILREPGHADLITECLVVNDGDSEAVSDLFSNFTGFPVKEIKIKKSKGSYHARNAGAEKAGGEWLLFLDSDVFLQEGALGSLKDCFGKGEYIAGNIRIEMSKRETLGEKHYRLTAFKIEDYFKKYRAGVTAFLAIKRKTFLHCGGFEEGFYSGGDFLLGQKVFMEGFDQVFCKNAIAVHKSRGFRNQFLLALRIEKGRRDIAQKYPEKFPFFKNEIYFLGREFYYMYRNLTAINRNELIVSGKLKKRELILSTLLTHSIKAVAKGIIKIFPNRKFNY